MACRLAGAKPLSEPMLEYCWLNPWQRISVKSQSKFIYFHSRRCIWKCRQEIGGHFFSASLCSKLIAAQWRYFAAYILVWIVPGNGFPADTLRNNVRTTSFWRSYVKITSFWRYSDIITTSSVWWVGKYSSRLTVISEWESGICGFAICVELNYGKIWRSIQ